MTFNLKKNNNKKNKNLASLVPALWVAFTLPQLISVVSSVLI